MNSGVVDWLSTASNLTAQLLNYHLTIRLCNQKGGTVSDWEPKIIAFLCNWCSYGAADLAGVSRMQYPPNIRVIRVPCSGRISPKFILSAFRNGADGVWVSG
nr:methyl viologen-reducing hydrogenase delta chain [uncultured archaeon GZfos18F2]